MRLIDGATKELPPEKSFLADLKRSIEMTDAKGARLPSQTYKPSGMNCIRSMYYQIIGKEPDPSSSTYQLVGICNSGSDIHQRVQQAVIDMKSNGIDCEYINVADFVEQRGLDYLEIRKRPDPEHGEYETKLYHKNYNMSFLCDGIIRYNGHYYILELKTETCNKWYTREDVDPKHYNQATAYSIAFGIDEVLFVYISRDNLDMKAFMRNVTDDMKMGLIGIVEECDGYVKRMITPPKPTDLPKSACTYCGYKNTCKGE